MNFAVDLDGVVINWDGGFRQAWNAMYPDKQIPAQSQHWESPFEDTGLSHTAFWKWIDDNDIYIGLPPMPGAVEAITRLSERHNISYVTNRHERSIDPTFQWTLNHGIYHPIHHVKSKGEFACDVAIDDNTDNLRAYVEGGHAKVVFRLVQPWNEHVEGTHPISSLSELH